MSTGELIKVEPPRIQFRFELMKTISCSLKISNKTDHYVVFQVKTTSPKKYGCSPHTGIILPRSTCNVLVMMQAQRKAPRNMQCNDKFIIQSVVLNRGSIVKYSTNKLFSKESNIVHEVRLRVVYVSRCPSPIPEGSEEGSSPGPSLPDDENKDALELFNTLLVSKLTKEKNSIIHENNMLRQELKLMRREIIRHRRRDFSFMFLVIVLLVVLLGYLAVTDFTASQ